jgi:hypothetical protein
VHTLTKFSGVNSEKSALSLQFTVEATMPLAMHPEWNVYDSCLWFETPYKAGHVLCRIDAQCFIKSLGAKSASGIACRAAFDAAKPRIHARALTQVESGRLDFLPKMVRRFVWLTDKDFAA